MHCVEFYNATVWTHSLVIPGVFNTQCSRMREVWLWIIICMIILILIDSDWDFRLMTFPSRHCHRCCYGLTVNARLHGGLWNNKRALNWELQSLFKRNKLCRDSILRVCYTVYNRSCYFYFVYILNGFPCKYKHKSKLTLCILPHTFVVIRRQPP